QGLQERSRVPLAEEAAGVRDAEAGPSPIAKAREVVEVAPVGDRANDTPRLRRAHRVRAPVARFTALPTKCTEPGGEVVITASMPSFRAIRIAAGIAVRFHVTLASGTSRRRDATRACTSARSRPSVPCSSSAGFRAFGPTYLARCTHACVGMRSSASRGIHLGCAGG